MSSEIDDEMSSALSPEEMKVLYYWQHGDTKTEAYKKVMLSPEEAKTITVAALKKRVLRFFNTQRMHIAMANTPTPRGEKAKEELKKWDESVRFGPTRNIAAHNVGSVNRIVNGLVDGDSIGINKKGDTKSDRDKWLESLNIRENPTSMTIYGTGQFLAYMAVKEIMARQDEIKRKHISVLDKNGSVFTPTIISALKTAAAMVLPFAPAPTAEDRKDMSKAAVLLGLMPENIKESPDDFTAPPPDSIDIE